MLASALLCVAVPTLAPHPALARADEDDDAADRRANAKKVREAAEDGDVKAQRLLGIMHAVGGKGVRHSYKEAAKWFKIASDAGDATSTFMLGELTRTGKGVDKDPDEALKLFRAAAAKNEPRAMVALGVAYAEGAGVDEDQKQAVSWFKRSAALNDPAGQAHLGLSLLSGKGIAKDVPQAAQLFHASADQGYGFGLMLWAAVLTNGDGTARDLPQAYMFALLADDRDVDGADKLVKKLAAQLSQAQQDESARRAKAWKPHQGGADAAPDLAKSGRDEDGNDSGGKEPAASTRKDTSASAIIATGTAFYVTPQGHLLTNHHVINGCGRLEAGTAGAGMVAVQVVADDPGNDLAVLKAAVTPASVASFRSGMVRQAEPVMAYGFPLTGLVSSTGNVTSGNITALTGMRDDTRYYQTSAPVQPGNSGGPLVDMGGNVVGVVVAKLDALKVAQAIKDIPQNINFAIKGSVATSFLESHSIAYASAPLGDNKSAPDVGEQAKAFTVLVTCWK